MNKQKVLSGLMAASVLMAQIPVSANAEGLMIGGAQPVSPGHTMQLVASGAEGEITWGISGQKNASTMITQDGVLTIADGEDARALTVIATLLDDPSVNGLVKISIIPAVPETPAPVITAVVLSGGGRVDAGNAVTFSAQVKGSGDYDKGVSWAVSGNQSNGTYIQNGILTVAENEKSTQLTVTAIASGNSRVYASTSVAVTPAKAPDPVVTGVTVNGVASTKPGQTVQLKASVSGNYGYDKSVTWSVSGAASAGTKISAAGVLTVGADETAKELAVTATANGDPSFADTHKVSVTYPVVKEPAAPEPAKKQYVSAKTDYISGEYTSGTATVLKTDPVKPVLKTESSKIDKNPGKITKPTAALETTASADSSGRPTGGTSLGTTDKITEKDVTEKVTQIVGGVMGSVMKDIKDHAEKEAVRDTENTTNASGQKETQTGDDNRLRNAAAVFGAACVMLLGAVGIKMTKNKKKKGSEDPE